MDTGFRLSIIVADAMLLVTLRFRRDADREVIDSCMFQIAEAFAAIEQFSEREMEALFWERKRLSPSEYCVVLRRQFTDPDYPQQFDAAFRRLAAGRNWPPLH